MPFTLFDRGDNTFRDVKSWKRQPKPYKKALGYVHEKRYAQGGNRLGTRSIVFWGLNYDIHNKTESLKGQAYNKALSKQKSAGTNLALMFAERYETFDSAAKLLSGAVKSLSKMLKGDLLGGVNAFPLKRTKHWRTALRRARTHEMYRTKLRNMPRRVTKAAGETWLSYWLCWGPLVGDLQNLMEGLDKDLNPWEKVQGSAAYEYKQSSTSETFRSSTSVKCTLKLQLENPKLLLLKQYGLLSPLRLGYEVIPFSFVAGWFVNFEDFLNRQDALIGYKLMDSWYSVKGSCERSYVQSDRIPNTGQPDSGKWITESASARGSQFQRIEGGGTPAMEWVFTPSGWKSLTRALTLTSLLSTQLKSVKSWQT